MATLTSQLIVSLLDKVSGPARGIANSIKGIGAAINAANAGGLKRMAEANTAALGKMRASMLEAVAVGYALKQALAAPIVAFAKFQSQMLDIAQKSDLGDEAMKKLGERIRKMAPQVNQTAGEIASGMDVLTSMGMDPDRALAVLPALSKAATAYKAKMSDVAKMTFAAVSNLNVPVEQTAKLLDVLATASKEGGFEFSDMAREFPAIAASAQALGEKGVVGVSRLAAALEVMIKGTGNASQAATNLNNVLMKANSPETIKKFKAHGVDIQAELEKAKASGADILETIADATMRAVKGKVENIGQIFEDVQARQGIQTFVQNWAEYRRIQHKALSASGVVEEDFKRRMKTLEAQSKALMISLDLLGLTVGETLVPAITKLVAIIQPLVNEFSKFAEAHPELVGGLIEATVGVVAMSIAARAAHWSFLFLRGGVLMLAQPLLKATAAIGGFMGGIAKAATVGTWSTMVAGLARLRTGFLALAILGATAGPGAVFKTLGGALLSLLNPLRLLMPLFGVLGAVFSPIGILIAAVAAAIAAAGLFIYNNWSGLQAMFLAFGLAFSKALEPAQPALDKVGAAFNKVGAAIQWAWGKISSILGPISLDTWAKWGAAAGTAVANVVMYMLELPGKISKLGTDLYVGGIEWLGRMYDGLLVGFAVVKDFFTNLPSTLLNLAKPLADKLYTLGVDTLQGLWDGMKSKFTELMEWIKGLGSEIRAALVSGLPDFVVNHLGLEGGGKAPAAANENTPQLTAAPRQPEMSLPVGEAAERLNQTVAPEGDASRLSPLEQTLDRLQGKVNRLNQSSISIGLAGGGGLRASGSVGWQTRGENSDFGM